MQRILLYLALSTVVAGCNEIFGIEELPADDADGTSGAGASHAFVVEQIADSQASVLAMAADETTVYWGAGANVVRWSSAEGVAPIAEGVHLTTGEPEPILDLALNAGFVAWISDNGAYALPRSASNAGPVMPVEGGLIETSVTIRQITIDPAYAYFTVKETLGRIDLAAGSATYCQILMVPTYPSHDGARLWFFGTTVSIA